MKRICVCCTILLLFLFSCEPQDPQLTLQVAGEVTTSSETLTLVLRNDSVYTIVAPSELESIEKFDGTNWVPLNRKGYHRKAFLTSQSLSPGKEMKYTEYICEKYSNFLTPGEYRIPITCTFKRIRYNGEWLPVCQLQDAWYFEVE